MKRTTLILLICINSLSTFGVGLQEFYCDGKLQSFSLSLADNSKHNCGKNDSEDDCCKIKYQSYKIKDDYLLTDGYAAPVKYCTEADFFNTFHQGASWLFQQAEKLVSGNTPAIYLHVPLYIYHCVFRI